MEDKKRTVMAVIIIVVVLAAVLYSFFLNLFTPTPHLEMPDPDASQSMDLVGEESGWPEGVAVEVTPLTVQSLIAALERYESYRRTVSVEYYSAGQSVGTVTAQVWADGGWTRTSAALNSGAVEHSIVGEDTLWLWYEGDGGRVYSGPAADRAADLAQRLPTYEDVLALVQSDIVDARYQSSGDLPCVYVAVEEQELGYVEEYWVSVDTGLLVRAESRKGEEVFYRMSGYTVETPATPSLTFSLPDGTALHSTSRLS